MNEQRSEEKVLPAWPSWGPPTESQAAAYERLQRIAAMARLRVAVQALESIREDSCIAGYDAGHAGIHCKALDALVAIGVLPNG